jgi:hypothetical protein
MNQWSESLPSESDDQHPRVVDARSGNEIVNWADLPTGSHTSPIDDRDRRPVALDPAGMRFGVASNRTLTLAALG